MQSSIKELEEKEAQMLQKLSRTYAQEKKHKEMLQKTKETKVAKRILRYDNYFFSYIEGQHTITALA